MSCSGVLDSILQCIVSAAPFKRDAQKTSISLQTCTTGASHCCTDHGGDDDDDDKEEEEEDDDNDVDGSYTFVPFK